jgi:uncharacterized lipoprotein YmbA
LLLVTASLATTGCLSRPPLAKETFALSLPNRSAPPKNGTNSLALRQVTLSPLFEGRAFVYRTGEHAYERDPYAEFLVPPERMLATAIREYLRGSGAFGAVLEPGSAFKPTQFAEVNVAELYGDFRKPEDTCAVLTLRWTLFTSASEPAVGFEATASRRIPLKDRTAAALVAGWNQALREILDEIATPAGHGRAQP